jgi:hypothetical protein
MQMTLILSPVATGKHLEHALCLHQLLAHAAAGGGLQLHSAQILLVIMQSLVSHRRRSVRTMVSCMPLVIDIIEGWQPKGGEHKWANNHR